MRYFVRTDLYKPKNCIWGPRFQEGIVLSKEEWSRMNDYGRNKLREKEEAEKTRRRREELRDRSLEMSSKWENSLTRLKERAKEKETKAVEKVKEDRLTTYKKILRRKWKENEKVLKEAYRLVYESNSTTKQILSGAGLSAVV